MFERLCPSVWFSASFCWTFFSLYLEETLVNSNWKLGLNFPPEKDQISQVQQPLQGKRIKDFEFNSICIKVLRFSNTCTFLELHVNELLKYQLPRSRRIKSTNQIMEQTSTTEGKCPWDKWFWQHSYSSISLMKISN